MCDSISNMPSLSFREPIIQKLAGLLTVLALFAIILGLVLSRGESLPMDLKLGSEDRKNLARSLPKIELHLHLDGSLSPEFMLEQSKLQEIEMPVKTAEEVRPWLFGLKTTSSIIVKKGGNWPAFDFCNQFLQTEEALAAAVKDILHRLHEENVAYAEIRFSPVLHTLKGMTSEQAVIAALEGFRSQDKVAGGIIVCAMRSYPEEHAREMAGLAEKYLARPETKETGVVGFDVCGDERSYPVFDDKFPAAKGCLDCLESGVPRVPHAGEFPDVDYETARNIIYALDRLKASRIGHGLALGRGLTKEKSGIDMSPQEMMKKAKDANVSVEVCLTSNVGVNHMKVPGGFKAHPVKLFYQNRLPFNLNSDNLLLSGKLESPPSPTNEILRLVEDVYGPEDPVTAWSAVRFELRSGADAILAPKLFLNGETIDVHEWRKEFKTRVDKVFKERGILNMLDNI